MKNKNDLKIEKNIQNEQNLIENINKFSSKKILKNLSMTNFNNFNTNFLKTKTKKRKISSSTDSNSNKFFTNNSTNNLTIKNNI